VNAVKLRDLYCGEAWQQTLRLEKIASLAGFAPRLLVASAGLGLRDADSLAPSYSATFSRGHLDSVATDNEEAKNWWSSLQRSSGSLNLKSELSGPSLLVLSETYSKAIGSDLDFLKDRMDVVLFGGHANVEAGNRIPSDGGLKGVLGGTSTSLNSRTAIEWIQKLDGAAIYSAAAHSNWRAWADESRRSHTYHRQPMTDIDVLERIRSLRVAQPAISKSAALRAVRDSGFACEQDRFGKLFKETIETQ